MKTETRTLQGCEIRADEKEFAVGGLAAPYNRPALIGKKFTEKIAPGAFTRSLRTGADVICTVQHDPARVLGRTKSGTLTLQDTPKGLAFRCQLDPESPEHRSLYQSVARGDLSECSFAFNVPDGGDEWNETGTERTLRNVDLKDVAIVSIPAYSGTAVAAREADGGDDDEEGEDRECTCRCAACKAWRAQRALVDSLAEDVAALREKLEKVSM
jgi:hypothetical protein